MELWARGREAGVGEWGGGRRGTEDGDFISTRPPEKAMAYTEGALLSQGLKFSNSELETTRW